MRMLLVFLFITGYAGRMTWAQSSPPLCTLQGGGEGGCVATADCNPATNTMYDDGSGIFNTRLGTDHIVCPPSQVCCSFPRVARSLDTTDCVPRTCGIQKRQTVPNFAKTKTNEADPGEFPWAVNLMIFLGMNGSKAKYQYTGTGSLIHNRVVLTAAHVLHNKDTTQLRVILGEHDQRKKVLPKKSVGVTEVVMHEEFTASNGNNNIALIFLKSPATKGLQTVGTVCLPPPSYVAPAGTRCLFSGWGVDSAGVLQNQLTKTEVPMMDRSACEQKLQQNPVLGPGFRLLPTLLCAGGEPGKDICGGAGGSPLVCPIESEQDRFIQTGLVNWVSAKCGAGGFPIVFSDVAAARPWIDRQMADHGYCTESYTY